MILIAVYTSELGKYISESRIIRKIRKKYEKEEEKEERIRTGSGVSWNPKSVSFKDWP